LESWHIFAVPTSRCKWSEAYSYSFLHICSPKKNIIFFFLCRETVYCEYKILILWSSKLSQRASCSLVGEYKRCQKSLRFHRNLRPYYSSASEVTGYWLYHKGSNPGRGFATAFRPTVRTCTTLVVQRSKNGAAHLLICSARLRNAKMYHYATLNLEWAVLSLGRDFIFTFVHLSNSSSLAQSDVYINNDFEGVSELNKPSKITC